MSNKDEKLLYKSMTDEQLVEATCNKQMAAFDELVIRHAHKLYHIILTRVRSEEVAYNISQKAFLKAFHSLRKLQERSKFFSWLYNTALDLAQDTAQPEGAIIESIYRLPEKYQIVVWHCLVNGESPEYVASMMDIPHETVLTHLSNATKSLQEKLAHLKN